ncbi:MAG: (d)CMP kinase [Chlamydiae bacterium]|nr:(d)CMP kinase [Chlamydiota bacterium]
MGKSFCVAIDGPSSSGKSTVAKSVARELGFFHIDSGAIYRALAWWMERQTEAIPNLDCFSYHIVEKGGKLFHYVGNIDVSSEIRSPYISQRSSEIAVLSAVRKKVNELQREIAKGRSVVIEGRDIGSVVFPHADVKIFLTADLSERARRRYEEFKQKGGVHTLEEVQKDLLERDTRDRSREDAPLVQCPDAYVVDTTEMTVGEVIEKIVTLTKRRKASSFWRFLVGEKRSGASAVYKIIVFCSLVLYKIFFRLEIKGIENYPEGALIIAPNHSSFLDPPAIGIACPNEVHCLAKSYLFENKLIGSILPKINTHPVSGDAGDLGVLKRISEFLLKGKQVIIFPEGTRSETNEVAPLKRGVALLASMAKCRVIPVGIKGAYEAWPKNKKFPRLFCKITVIFGKPLDWKDYEKKYSNKKQMQSEFTKDLEEAIKALSSCDKS